MHAGNDEYTECIKRNIIHHNIKTQVEISCCFFLMEPKIQKELFYCGRVSTERYNRSYNIDS